MYSNTIYRDLEVALENGIKECEFWEMTYGELIRYVRAKQKVEERELQLRASMDYIHANLVVKGIAGLFSSASKMPKIYEVYPTLFDDTEIKQKDLDNKAILSVERFKQFAEAHNKNFKQGGAKVKDE